MEGKESGLASQELMIGTSGAASVVQPAANMGEVKKTEKCRSCKNGRCYAKKEEEDLQQLWEDGTPGHRVQTKFSDLVCFHTKGILSRP